MPDRREQILERMEAVLGALSGFETSVRNDIVTAESSMPALMLLDGDENTGEDAFDRGRPPAGVFKMTMMPEVYILAEADVAEIGPLLNRLRYRVVFAVLNDPQLKALAHNGGIRYEGGQSGLALGRSLAGEMGLNFSIDYALNATEEPEDTTD